MKVTIAALALGVAAAAAPAGAQTLAEPVKARMQEMVQACVTAGGRVGQPTGQGQFIFPIDFTGDGQTDFLVSEGNFPCNGRPTLFRPDGLARVELYLADGRLAFADRLLAYRIVSGIPPRVQIARRGPDCGAKQCGDELRWNLAADRFDEHATDGRKVEARPAAGAVAAAPVAAPAAAQARAPVAAAAGVVGVPPVRADAESRFRARCRKDTLAASGPQAAKWADDHCADEWNKAVAAQPFAEALLLANGAGAGPVEGVRRALPMVRWAPRPEQGQVASGRLGVLTVGLAGTAARADRFVGIWRATGAEIPVDLAIALEARGATLTLTKCEKIGPGEGERVWQVAMPGRQPFELYVSQRTAPTGGALSFWLAEGRLDNRPARKGSTRCDGFW